MESTLFPIRPEMHIILAVASLIVFGIQFFRYRKKYHLLLAVGIPCSLLPYVVESKALFYGVGIAEAVLLVVCLILAKTIDRDKEAPAEEAPAQEAAAE